MCHDLNFREIRACFRQKACMNCVMIHAQLGEFRKILDASLREKVVDMRAGLFCRVVAHLIIVQLHLCRGKPGA